MEIVAGDLYLLDRMNIVLVLAVEHDGISEDYICVLVNEEAVWVSRFRLLPLTSG